MNAFNRLVKDGKLMNIFIKNIPLSLALPIALFLTSCSLIPEPEGDVKKFTLTSISPQKPSPSHTNRGSIIIDQPFVASPLDQSRVAIRPTNATIDYISGIEWADRLSTLLHENIVQNFQNSGNFASVGRLSSGVHADFMLTLDVRKFEKSSENCCVEVEYFAQLSDVQTHQNKGSQLFNTRVSLAHSGEMGVIEALNNANQKALLEMVNWVNKQISH
jgi:cholesterol transport system auxiliary component